MPDENKTKAELIKELRALRRKVSRTKKILTDHEGVAQALNESEERFKKLFEFAPDGYYLHTLDAVFIDGSREAERIVGYDKEKLIGRNFMELDLLSTDQLPKAAANLALNMEGQPTGPDEFVLKRKDGRLVSVEITSVPVKFKSETVVLAIARDITKRKEAEQERQRLSSELDEAQAHVKKLSGLVPICAWCKKIRDDKGFWQELEIYLHDHSEAVLSHGMCPECHERLNKE